MLYAACFAMRFARNSRLSGLAVLLLFFSPSSWPLDSDDELEFLPVEQAFPLTINRDSNGEVRLFWLIPKGYYLYKKKFSFYAKSVSGNQALDATFPAGVFHEDEFFGRSEVFSGKLLIRLHGAALTSRFVLEIRSQGCADAGLCYPPRKQYFEMAASQRSPSKRPTR